MGIGIRVVPNRISVSYEELDGYRQSYCGTRPYGTFRGSTAFKVAWADRHTFRRDVLGGMRTTDEGLVYYMPMLYPDINWAAAHETYIEPMAAPVGSSRNILQYEYAKIRVEFASRDTLPSMQYSEILTVTESIEPSAEFITLPNKSLYWSTGKTNELEVDEAPAAMIRMIDWVYTIHEAPFISAAVFNLIGCCNNANVSSQSLGWVFPPETLLYSYPSLTREFTTSGAHAWEITMRFTYREQGWNRFPRRGKGLTFERIYDENDNIVYLYPLADLSGLLI